MLAITTRGNHVTMLVVRIMASLGLGCGRGVHAGKAGAGMLACITHDTFVSRNARKVYSFDN